MYDEINSHDWYAVLSVPASASVDEISRAYRMLARIHHPDRNAGDPNAAKKFQILKRASEILLDKKLRDIYDSGIRAKLLREKRDRETDEHIRLMRNDLFNRENLANEERAARQANEFDRASMLRQESARIMFAHSQKQAELYSKVSQAKASSSDDYTVVLKWKKSRVYTADDLSTRLSSYGHVNIAVVSKKGGSGIVSFSRLTDALNAVSALNNTDISQGESEFISVTLKSKFASGKSSTDIANGQDNAQHDPPRKEHSEYKTQTHHVEEALSDADFEKMVLQKLRDVKKPKPSKT